MKFNINDTVRAKLTDYGTQYYTLFHRTLGVSVPAAIKSVEMPLWELMQIFGPTLHMGMRELPFVDNEVEIVRWKPGRPSKGTWLPLPSSCQSKARPARRKGAS